MKASKVHAEYWIDDNLKAARVILESPIRYAGIMVEWANMVIRRYTKRPEAFRAQPVHSLRGSEVGPVL